MTPTGAASGCAADRHGDANAYNVGCRCPAARADATRRRTRHQLRVAAGERPRVDATGTRRRIRALIANGWPRRILAAELAIAVTALDTYQRRQQVLATTADRVSDLYNRLADIPGPSDRARAQARAAGFLPPLWWDDDTIDDPNYKPELPNPSETRRPKFDIDPVAVDRAIAGIPSDLMRRGERLEAVRILRDGGLDVEKIADRIHVSRRQIDRDLHDIRAAAEQLAATTQKESA